MKIAFIESFVKKEWNGYTARYIEGVSGTHSSIFYLAEAVAKLNHDVSVIQIETDFSPKWVNGVYYQSMESIPDNDTTFYDVLVCTFALKDLLILNKIKNYNKIAFIMNCIELCKHNNLNQHNFYNLFDFNKINILYVSENCKINSFFINNRIENVKHHLLYDSIDMRDFTNSQGELFTFPENQKENNFVFFACIERGFNIVLEVAKKFQGKFNIVASNYSKKKYIADQDETKTFSIVNDIKILHPVNTSKKEILHWNRKSKYFIYPLVNVENDSIHYDTFGYVVLEALLCGTIVIAPRMRVFEELYGDAIYYIDTTDLVDDVHLVWSHWYNPENSMIFNKLIKNLGYPTIDRYVSAIEKLENDPELRRTHIERGFSLKHKFSNDKMANSFLNFIQS